MSFIEVSVNDFGFVWFVSFCFACFGWFLLFFFFLWYLSGDRIQDWRQFRLLFTY